MVTELSASHVVVPGVNRHVAVGPVVARPMPVARAEVAVMVVNATVEPGNTSFDSGVAEGTDGGSTVKVIVDDTVRFKMSVTWYVTGAAVPANVGNGSNVTTPVVGSTVYVPSPGTVRDVLSQAFGV
jgi:hypothetical protein